MKLNEELWLVVVIAAVWAVLAAVYTLAPGLGMPGYVRGWGGGAVLFLMLAGVLVAVSRKATRG